MTPHQKYDVFVSYAVAENEPPSGAKEGWVAAFVRTLKQEFRKTRLGRRVDVQIWWDEKNLDRTEDIRKHLKAILADVEVVVILLSQAYLESQWCTDEREDFLEALRGRPLADKRMFVVDLGGVAKDDRPDPLKSMRGYPFCNAEGVKYGHPYPNVNFESHLSYFNALPKIAEDVINRLAEIDPRRFAAATDAETGDDAGNGQPAESVYVAETTDDLDELRREIALDLKQHGFRVVPEKRLSSELTACRQQIEQAMEQSQARVFVQLLDDKLGKKFDDSDETIVTLQHQLAAAQHLMVLQWRGPDVNVAKVTNSPLKSLLTHPQVSADPLELFKAEVRNKVRNKARRPSAVSEPASRPKIYVQSDVVDDDRARSMARLLADRCGVVSRHPRRSSDPAKSAKLREDMQSWLLEVCDGIVILYGVVAVDWVDDQIDTIMKLKAKRSRPLRLQAIYMGPPKEKDDPSIFDPDVKLIDARQSDEIILALLEPLIKPLFTANGGEA